MQPDTKLLPRLLTAKEAAKFCGISTRTLWRWVSGRRIIQPLHIGETRRWDRAALEQWIESGCPKVEG
ncbi:helix-turn-helix domain-containing protein [Rhodopirellula sp. MGV]|uniref:helix-turn-helix transcriptional regulator n=1 Tax=Rhodopirellula sp. MGV TaxID=2023130 RepID=UPI0013045D41